jgi:signal peptidase I
VEDHITAPGEAVQGRRAGHTAPERLSTLLLVVLVLALGAATWGVLTGQWRAHSVLSGSMEPSLPVGSVAITERVRTSSLEVGDVITFREPDDPAQLVTHRIVSITKEDGRLRYETKGDANDAKDPWKVTLRGHHSYLVIADVPYLGYVVTTVRHPDVRPWLLAGAGVLMLAAVVNVFLPDRPPHRTRRPADPSHTELSTRGVEPPQPSKEMAQ